MVPLLSGRGPVPPGNSNLCPVPTGTTGIAETIAGKLGHLETGGIGLAAQRQGSNLQCHNIQGGLKGLGIIQSMSKTGGLLG